MEGCALEHQTSFWLQHIEVINSVSGDACVLFLCVHTSSFCCCCCLRIEVDLQLWVLCFLTREKDIKSRLETNKKVVTELWGECL